MMTTKEFETLFRDAAERSPVPWIPAEYAEQMSHLTLVWVKLIEGDEWKYQIATRCRGIFYPLYWGNSSAIEGNPRIKWFKPDDGRLETLLTKVRAVNFPSWEINSMDKAFKEILGG